MTELATYVSYYRDCFLESTRTIGLTNFFGRKAEKRYVFEGSEDLVCGNLDHVPVDPEWAAEIDKVLRVYRRERSLFYAAFFLIGNGGLESRRKLCAPLFLFPARLIEKDGYRHLTVSHTVPRINWSVFSTYRNQRALESSDWLAEMPLPPYDFGGLNRLINWITKYFDGIAVDEMLLFPDLVSEANLKALLRSSRLRRQGEAQLIPACGALIMRKSSATLGISADLRELCGESDFSTPLNVLFGKEGNSRSEATTVTVPQVLSRAQRKTVDAASQYPLSLAIGPPGTGKSFTIANLAIGQIAMGNSVLICSRTEQALEVVHQKLSTAGYGDVAQRIGQGDELKNAKKVLQNILSGIYPVKIDESIDIKKLDGVLRRLVTRVDDLEAQFAKEVKNENSWGRTLGSESGNANFLDRLRYKYVQWRNQYQTPLHEILDSLGTAERSRSALYSQSIKTDFVHSLVRTLGKSRLQLTNFLRSIRARNTERKLKFNQDLNWRTVLGALPLWISPLADIHLAFPLQKELFDLVIVDEASQCDIAACLPLLQRAKRAVFFGDPNQLRHVSFLSQAQMDTLRAKHGLDESDGVSLDFRRESILDFVQQSISDNDSINLLDEHFRSRPKLIQFSNSEFYGDRLRIMTRKPGVESADVLRKVNVEGSLSDEGTNEAEIDSVLVQVAKFIREQEALAPELKSSVGILSPFRDQVDGISARLGDEVSPLAMLHHNILCGTAYSFQGEERDVMLLSLALDDRSSATAFRYLNRDDVLNVSITRARGLQYVYHSFSEDGVSGSLIGDYLTSIDSVAARPESTETVSQFRNEVMLELNQLGVECWPSFEVAGLELDLVAGTADRFLGIDLIGYPDELGEAIEIDRYKILARAGLSCFPLAFSDWHFERAKCLDAIVALLARDPSE